VAASLKGGNQELIAASRLVENLPSLVTAAADGIADANLTIFNGAEGVSQVITGLVGQGMSILDTLKKSTAAGRTEAVEAPGDSAAALPPPGGNGAASPAPPSDATKS